MDDQTWQRVRALLVEQEYARRIAAGTLDKGRLRDLIGTDVDRMAREHGAAWKRQQADRLLGAVKRPGTAHECPACGISFNPDDRAAPPATPSPPLHDRWTNGATVVAVPPELEDAYQRLGYRRLEPELDAALDGTPPPSSDEPTRGADGLLYCRAACAAGEPTVTLDEWLAANPDRAAAGSFLRRYIGQTSHGARLEDLVALVDDDAPPVELAPSDPRTIADPAARARAAIAAYPHPADPLDVEADVLDAEPIDDLEPDLDDDDLEPDE